MCTKLSVLSLVAALSFAASQAHAADGDCCLDLEARLAELEAAGAHKGNHKVSLTITGYVTKQIMFWDDGVESNAYISDIGPTQATNFRLTGEAAIAAGWKAGYMVRIQDLSDNPMGLSQTTAHVDLGLNTQMANWYVASKQLGKLSVGKNALAAKSAAMFTDLSGTQVIANYVLFDGGGFFLRDGDALLGLRWGDLGYCYSQARPWGGDCDGIVMTGVRYDSPTFAGFSMSASWGVDDDWEVAGRYAGEAGGFKISLGAGYSVNTDEDTQPPPVSESKDFGVLPGGRLRAASRHGAVPARGLRRGEQPWQADACRLHRAQLASVVREGRGAAAVVCPRPHRPLRRVRPIFRSALAQRARGRSHGKRVHALRARRRAGDRCGVHVGMAQVSRAQRRRYRPCRSQSHGLSLCLRRGADQLLAAIR